MCILLYGYTDLQYVRVCIKYCEGGNKQGSVVQTNLSFQTAGGLVTASNSGAVLTNTPHPASVATTREALPHAVTSLPIILTDLSDIQSLAVKRTPYSNHFTRFLAVPGLVEAFSCNHVVCFPPPKVNKFKLLLDNG